MKTIKILFADDDLKYSMLLKRFLEAEGYEVTYAGNGSIALQQFPLIRPDLVLLDINMPGLDGLQVCQRIRNFVSCPILFLTARVEDSDKINGFAAAIDTDGNTLIAVFPCVDD